jgi:hypothetical protein
MIGIGFYPRNLGKTRRSFLNFAKSGMKRRAKAGRKISTEENFRF